MNNFLLKINNLYVNILAETSQSDCSILGDDLQDILNEVFTAIKVCVPILCVVLISIDMLSAVTYGDEKNMKDAQNKAIKRIIIGIVIFFIPTLVNLLLKWIGLASGTCGIG